MNTAVLPRARLRRLFDRHIVTQTLFWSWNTVFVLFVLAGVAPNLLEDFLRDLQGGLLPIQLVLALLAVVLVPTVATVVGLLWFRRRPDDVYRLFFGLELPLFFVALFCLFCERQLNRPLLVLLAGALLGMLSFACELEGSYQDNLSLSHPIFRSSPLRPQSRNPQHRQGYVCGFAQSGEANLTQTWARTPSTYRGASPERHSRPRTWPVAALRVAGLSLLASLGAYIALLSLIYLVPIVWLIGGEVVSFDWVRPLLAAVFESLRSCLLVGLGSLLLAYTMALLVALPVVALRLYTVALANALRSFPAPRRWFNRLVAASTAALLALTLVLSCLQPQRHAFARLSPLPASDSDRQDLLNERDRLRDGLCNAYLARHRYLGSSNDQGLAHLYLEAFGGSDVATWQGLQRLHTWLAAPWVYQTVLGSIWDDSRHAAVLYRSFFDQPIDHGERDQVLKARGSTFRRASFAAGLLDRDAERVLLVRQEVDVVEHGDWAELELHEVYENQTDRIREVVISFALPHSAVVTGLWLGDSDDRRLAHRFVVAPRGAAQSVYRQELQRRIDPALLEQVGPQQYRLRVFPIPTAAEGEPEAVPHVHLWLRLAVLGADDGWPMPRLLERRNLFWTADTERYLRGAPEPLDSGGWTWDRIRAIRQTPPVSHQVLLAGGIQVRCRPQSLGWAPPPLPAMRIAVVLDRSYSMEQHRHAVRQTADWLTTNEDRITADWFLTSAPSRGEPPHRDAGPGDEVVFYGGHSTSHLLQQYLGLRGEDSYDAVIVLTDGGGYNLEKPTGEPLPVSAPLWLVHLGDGLPIAYADPVLDAMQHTGGGIAFDLPSVLERMAAEQRTGRTLTLLRDRRLWEVERTGTEIQAEAATPFAPLAARAAVDALGRLAAAGEMAELDRLHGLARAAGIVTPYSSMIVLVNDQQRQALAEASVADDRFAREVSGVPEPEHWLLLAVGLILVLWRLRSGR